VIQGKLIFHQTNDPLEKEADQVSEKVMQMPESKIAGKSISQQISPAVQRKSEIQPSEETSNLTTKIDGLKGGGEPLSQKTKDFFEPRFGKDFSKVRIHTDTNANQLAQSIQARAFTKGNDIVFGRGEYNFESFNGKKLLGHELTHVVQQRQNRHSSVINKKKIKTLSDRKYKFLVDLSSAKMFIWRGSQLVRVVKILSGQSTWTLIRHGRSRSTKKWQYGMKSYRIRRFYDGFVINPKSKPYYYACTWFPWGKELTNIPHKREFKYIKPPKGTKSYLAYRGDASNKYTIQRNNEKWDTITKYCNPFGKHWAVIKGNFMLHGTDGNPGNFLGSSRERREYTSGCIRTDNNTIKWLKSIVNNQSGGVLIQIRP
jgi:hypothetical protein